MKYTPAYTSPVQRSILPTLLLGGALLVVGVLATVGTLWGMGYIDLPFFQRPKPAGPSYEGMIMVPTSVTTIPPYTQITRDHLLDPKTGALKTVPLPPASVESAGVLYDLSKIIGRVLAKEKPVGFAFTESDFLPPGTPPGLAGGTPEGRVSMAIEAEKVKGVHTLQQGDHFDIVGTLPLDDKKTPQSRQPPRLFGLAPLPTEKHASVHVLVKDGIILRPLHVRQVLIPGTHKKGAPETQPVEYVEIAVGPEDAAALSEALSLKAGLNCFVRSGRKGAPAQGVQQPPPRVPKVTTIETIIGGKREILEFSSPPEPPRKGDGKSDVTYTNP